MIIRAFKAVALGTVAFYAARAAKSQAKLLAVRAEAKQQMNELEAILKNVYERSGEFSSISHEECGRLFTVYFDQYKRVTKIYNKTF